ncbi:hypothetical protein V1505DRAFT_53218 [Lipomyces doorenjongii]
MNFGFANPAFRVLSVSKLRVFGCLAHHLVTDRHKLDNKTKVAVFVGYPHEQSGYRLYDPETQKLLVSRNVTFDEKRSYKDLVSSHLDPTPNTTPIISLNDNSQSEITSDGRSSFDSSCSCCSL